ncbi:MAG: GNAT family N-acetyltransferase [Alphaproteobacteria bacterium]
MGRLPIRTPRLRLRRLRPGDAAAVTVLMGNWNVVKQTGGIPYPYSEAAARDWIAVEARDWARGVGCSLAVEDRETGALCGAVSLRASRSQLGFRRGELGYWLGEPYWGRGLATEAVTAALAWFAPLARVRTIEAVTFAENHRSIGVLTKAGFRLRRIATRSYPARGGRRHIHLYQWAVR